MARLTKAQREWRPGMPKKLRSTKVMFASTVLGLEAFVVFFGTLVAVGMTDLPTVGALVVGLILAGLMIFACAGLRRPLGYSFGWVLQLLLIATGIFVPAMYIVGVLFTLTWWWGLRSGGRIDRENAQRAREQEQWEQEHPGE